MFEPNHLGLYFSAVDLETFKTHNKREPFKSAVQQLTSLNLTDPLAQAVAAGFRYRFLTDESAGATAHELLINHSVGLNLSANSGMSYIEACATTMAAGQSFELVRDLLPEDVQRGWLKIYTENINHLRDEARKLTLIDEIWRTAMKITGAVVMERDDIFVLGIEDFKRIVSNHIHPEGYLPKLVQPGDGGALQRQLFAAKGLSLAAEAATHAGTNLWTFESRGISAKTAAIYAAAYYEYRETWKWDDPPSPEDNDALYQQNAGFFEMLNRQLDPTVLRTTVDQLRPIFDPYGGGMTTLSHGIAKKGGLFGFLGR